MLNYVTYKYVILKDYRLGLFYYVLASLIILYTLIEILYNKGYLEVIYTVCVCVYTVCVCIYCVYEARLHVELV